MIAIFPKFGPILSNLFIMFFTFFWKSMEKNSEEKSRKTDGGGGHCQNIQSKKNEMRYFESMFVVAS